MMLSEITLRVTQHTFQPGTPNRIGIMLAAENPPNNASGQNPPQGATGGQLGGNLVAYVEEGDAALSSFVVGSLHTYAEAQAAAATNQTATARNAGGGESV